MKKIRTGYNRMTCTYTIIPSVIVIVNRPLCFGDYGNVQFHFNWWNFHWYISIATKTKYYVK
jgi:hypothetical protein